MKSFLYLGRYVEVVSLDTFQKALISTIHGKKHNQYYLYLNIIYYMYIHLVKN